MIRNAYAIAAFGSLAITNIIQPGTNIFERDWDLLIVLDACRTDALESVSNEFDWLQQSESMWSVGSTSKEWIANTFTSSQLETIQNTTYITGNGFASDVLEGEPDWTEWGATNGTWISRRQSVAPLIARDVVGSNDLESYHPIWHLSDRHGHGHTPYAEDVTDYVITVGRKESPDQTIVHYMQPHAPYLANRIENESLEEYQRKPLQTVREGSDKDLIWDEYLDNLKYVLSEVNRLLKNFDANKAVITSDHGELFGEFGLYDHGVGILHPALRKVPWVETTATDQQTCDPEVDITEQSSTEVRERLEDLGYF